MVTITVAIAVVVFLFKKTNALLKVILFRYFSTISAIGEQKVVIIPIGLRTFVLSFLQGNWCEGVWLLLSVLRRWTAC